jgi:hypothetical protein
MCRSVFTQGESDQGLAVGSNAASDRAIEKFKLLLIELEHYDFSRLRPFTNRHRQLSILYTIYVSLVFLNNNRFRLNCAHFMQPNVKISQLKVH